MLKIEITNINIAENCIAKIDYHGLDYSLYVSETIKYIGCFPQCDNQS